VPSLSKKFLTCLFGGQIGTGPFFKEIGGSGIALTIFAFTLIAFLSWGKDEKGFIYFSNFLF